MLRAESIECSATSESSEEHPVQLKAKVSKACSDTEFLYLVYGIDDGNAELLMKQKEDKSSVQTENSFDISSSSSSSDESSSLSDRD